MISLVTNASLADAERIRNVIPHWLRVFGHRFSELTIVFDPVPVTGRIKDLHGRALPDAQAVRRSLEDVSALDSRIRVVELPSAEDLLPLTRKWFHRGHPVRCHAGTPILAFLYAMEQGRSDVVLRADCDILFFESGWLDQAERDVRSGEFDLVEPPRPGCHGESVSTRVLLFSPPGLAARKRLPMTAHRLDPLRRLHRRLLGRPPWLALEQMFDADVKRRHLTHRILDTGGYFLHVASHADMIDAAAKHVVERVECDDIPGLQRGDPNYRPEFWPPVV